MKTSIQAISTFCFLIILMTSCSSPTPSPQVNQTQVMEAAVSAALTQAIKTQMAPTPTPTPDPEVISLANANQLVLKLMSMGGMSGPVAYSPDGKWLYLPTNTGVYAYDTTSYKNVHLAFSSPGGTFSPNGTIFMRGNDLFLTEGMQQLPALDLLPVGASPYDRSKTFFSPDESFFARYFSQPQTLNGIETQRRIAVWRVRDGKLINTFEAGDMAISADNRLIAIGRVEHGQSTVYLYDLQTGEKLGHWPGGHPAFLSDNSLVVGANGYTRILDPVHHKTRRGFGGTRAVFSPDERSVALWDRHYINVYQVADGRLISRFELELPRIEEIIMHFSPDGQVLAGYTLQRECCAGYSSNLSLWRVSDGNLIKKLRPSAEFVFSPDSQAIMVGAREVSRTSDGSLVADISQSCDTSYNNLAFTPDGQQVILDCYVLYLYPVRGGSPWTPEKVDRETYRSTLDAVSFSNYHEVLSPDGQFLARKGTDFIVVSSTWGDGKEFTIPAANVTCFAFSPDHQILALCLKDGSVDLWDLNNQRFAYTILQDINAVSLLAFSPDGKSLVIRATDRTVRLYGINAK